MNSTTTRRCGLAIAGILLSGVTAWCSGDAMRVQDAVRPRPEPPGAPRASEVCMRSLRPRPVNASDPHDTLAAIRDFHVTRLEWTYSSDAAFIEKVKALGASFGAASAAGTYSGDAPAASWTAVDLDGRPLVPTWMRQWPKPNPWGCANNPEFRAGHLRYALTAVRAGADLLQRDEPGQNELATRWGGCFCDACVAAFRAWLPARADAAELRTMGVDDPAAFDVRAFFKSRGAPSGDALAKWDGGPIQSLYLEFQTDSTIGFHRWWREELNRQAGRHVPVSCNNGAHRFTPVEAAFDFHIGELSSTRARPAALVEMARSAAALGRTQTVTMPLRRDGEPETPDWIRHNRQALATAHAAGCNMELPWDTYLPTGDAKRYFGRPENYADLTAFIRAAAGFLDGYGDAFAAGAGVVADDRWSVDAPPVAMLDADDEILVTLRALPGRPGAPVAVHLVDWRDEPKPFRLSLRASAFFGATPPRATLLTPVRPVDASVHRRAFETGDYNPLINRAQLVPDKEGYHPLPALSPWAIVVLENGAKQ